MSRISAVHELIPLAALAVALVTCVWAEPIGKLLSVMDLPDGCRKHHDQPTPLVGGIAIMLSLLVWGCITLLTGHVGDQDLLLAVLLCGTGISLVGFADDQSSTLPLARASSLVIFTLVAFAVDRDLLVRPLLVWGSFAPTLVPAGVLAGLLCLSMVGFVNAVNMADGQNGIVAGMFVVWSLCLILVGDRTITAIAELLLASCVIVLAFNLAGRLFLGDCGAYGVSFVFGLLAIAAHAKGLVSVETIVVWFFIPVIDCLRLTFMRPLRGLSPVSGGRDHFHHHLQARFGRDLGLATYVGIVGSAALLVSIEPRFNLACIAALSATYACFTLVTIAPSAVEEDDVSTDPYPQTSNVISFSESDAPRKVAK